MTFFRALAVAALLIVALGLVIARWASLDEDARRLAPAERAVLMTELRAVVEGSIATVTTATPPGLATLYCRGRPVARARLPGAVGLRSDAVVALGGDQLRHCRLVVDLVRGRGPLIAAAPLFSFSLVPGIDGLGVALPDREVLLTADDLLLADVNAGHRPLPSVEVALGLDGRSALRLLAARAGLDGDAWRRTPHRLFRFRAESFVESPGGGPPLTTLRGRALSSTPTPVDPPRLAAAAARGGHYLVRHLRPDGRFDYLYDTLHDQPLGDAEYSVTRHAGAAGFLAQLHRATRDAAFHDAAVRALARLADHHPAGCDRPTLACVGEPDADVVDLGAAALALAAAAELERAGDATFAPWARRLAAFLTDVMQRPDGSFAHLYRPDPGARDDGPRMPYFSGEAAFALALLATLEPRWQEPARRGLDALLAEADATFLGRFLHGEDHWTCLAVDAAWDFLDEPRRARLGDYCESFARFLARTQFTAGDGPLVAQPDLEGSYGFTPLIPPHTTPVGSRAEALVSIRRIAARRGHARAAEEISTQLARGLRFLLDHQITPDSGWLMPDPASADGGFLMSDVERQVRIDFVQHAGSALLRSATEPQR